MLKLKLRSWINEIIAYFKLKRNISGKVLIHKIHIALVDFWSGKSHLLSDPECLYESEEIVVDLMEHNLTEAFLRCNSHENIRWIMVTFYILALHFENLLESILRLELSTM
jgi:hypothetical protein